MTTSSQKLNSGLRRFVKIIGYTVFASLILGRCAFEAGAFSSQQITIPDNVVLSSFLQGNEGNQTVDAYMEKTMRQLQQACWKSGWRSLARSFLYTGPSAITVSISDSVLGTRELQIDCSDL